VLWKASIFAIVEVACHETPKNTIFNVTVLDRTPVVPNCRRLLPYPNQQTLGAFFCPCMPISAPNRRISIFLVHEPIKILLSNVEGLNHLPLPPNYRILLSNHTQPMPTTLLSTGGSIVVITNHFVVCHIGTNQPQPSVAVCDLDEADSIRDCCVLLLDTNALVPSEQEKDISFPTNAMQSPRCQYTPQIIINDKIVLCDQYNTQTTTKSTPKPSALVPANIRTFSIPSND